jgi:NADH dehydrogenase [ubiquinone] 1 alpha subcomplex assembly factor 7
MSNPRADDGEAPLLAKLRALIRRDGPMPVDRYMHLCQADPEHGYWQQARSIGAGGDFITAPEISQVFGELIGLWCAVVWQGMGRPAPLRLIELGPGRGTLMRDALRAARTVHGILDALAIHLIETSPPLRALQEQAFPPRHAEGVSSTRRGKGKCPPVIWHSSIDDVPDGLAIIIANEFLDALPIRQLVFVDGTWRERMIDADAEGRLRFATGPTVDHEAKGPAQPEASAILELRTGEDEVVARLAGRQSPLVALFIDYGPAEPAYGDTLQAVYRHASVDPLSLPGRADLTAHIRFASLADKARAAGLVVDGPIVQAEFLGRLGIAERAARLMAANPERASEIETGVHRLMSPTGMGEQFKAMTVRSGTLPPLPPFV